ncbi:MFS general substrate transporter [Corynespora cassiicola Philippines]|uniref:MFS general substrate transporter n=1 Tax=Corynespora cassiicola Philippines TaxID=1448308 RepID=A0A2T2P8S9_CORCC|nr:MFS general substrate transporter [Corynespora cassiicola Philippines]
MFLRELQVPVNHDCWTFLQEREEGLLLTLDEVNDVNQSHSDTPNPVSTPLLFGTNCPKSGQILTCFLLVHTTNLHRVACGFWTLTIYPQDQGNNIVDWDGPDDPENPRNWPARKKFVFVLVTSGMIQAVSFGSSVIAPSQKIIAADFDVPLPVAQLTVSLWILGLFAGPIFFGPLSEIYGHVVPLTIGMSGMALFQIPIAVATNIQTILVGRFLSGVFGSSSFAIVSGMYVELYEPTPRGVALALASISINVGASIAPIAGAFLSYNVHWRWTAWITLIFAAFLLFISIFTVQESSTRKILRSKAARLRYETRNWALHSKSEETQIGFSDIAQRYLTKPIRMFATEPILVIVTLYLTLVYGTLYLSFQAFPIVYLNRGWSPTSSSLPFLAVTLGILSAFILCSIFMLTWYKKRVSQFDGPPLPEWRLPPMIAGALTLPPSLLWFGWTVNSHWISQVFATYFIGLSLMLIFICGIIYIVDVYQKHANSAMSIHVVFRSLVASSFPLWAAPMYARLGVTWACSVLALLSFVLVPAPILLFLFGHKVRRWGISSFQ